MLVLIGEYAGETSDPREHGLVQTLLFLTLKSAFCLAPCGMGEITGVGWTGFRDGVKGFSSELLFGLLRRGIVARYHCLTLSQSFSFQAG